MNQQTGLSPDSQLAGLNEAKHSQLRRQQQRRGLGIAPLRRIYGPASVRSWRRSRHTLVLGCTAGACCCRRAADLCSVCVSVSRPVSSFAFPSAELLQLGRGRTAERGLLSRPCDLRPSPSLDWPGVVFFRCLNKHARRISAICKYVSAARSNARAPRLHKELRR